MKAKVKSFTQKTAGRYDLPLHRGSNSRFILLLITMMSFLAILALSASFTLGNVAKKWSSGLENKVTVELPVVDDIEALKIDVKKKLDTIENIKSVDVMSDDALISLVSPWLGDDFSLDDVPMPSLIAVEITETSSGFLQTLQNDLKAINPDIILDTHEEWLNDFLTMIHTLTFATFFISIIIAATAAVAVTGIIRARIAEHRADVELLHLMGASDNYIAGQFQRYATRIGLAGGFLGLLIGILAIGIFALGLRTANTTLMPALELNAFASFVLLSVPLMACALCNFTAKIAVLRSLARMP